MEVLHPRHKKLLEMTGKKGFISTEELTNIFQVTPQTIRRDINELCKKGFLKRYHGGAGLISSVENFEYSTRQILNHYEKLSIAKLIAKHIPNKASIFINIGTTNEEIAKALSEHSGLRVITNNLNVASYLSKNTKSEVIVASGVVRSDGGIIGESTIDFIKQFKVDYGVIGTSGIDEDGTLLDYDYREVRVAQAIMEHSRNIFLATDHTKFGRNPMVKLGHITSIKALFTDKNPPSKIIKLLSDKGIALHVADKG